MYNSITTSLGSIPVVCSLLVLAACGGAKLTAVQDLKGHEDLSLFTLHSVAGTRDGERLQVQAILSDSSSILTVEMHFAVGSPTTLESGTWRWPHNGQLLTGAVSARSTTFLGGQDGPPSIGGTFDLLGADGVALYRIKIPVTQLKARWKG